MTEEEISVFLGKLKTLSNGDRIELKRSTGQFYDTAPYAIRLSVLYTMSEGLTENAVQMQNIFFTAQIFSANSEEQPKETAQTAIARLLRQQESKRVTDTDFSKSKMSDILTGRTGKRGDLYQKIEDVLYGEKVNIDCFSLLRDLNNWNHDSIKRKWANAYIREKRRETNE